MKNLHIFSQMLLLSISLSGCNFSIPQPPPTPEPIFTEVIDCLWRATGKSWNDDNKNGTWDSTEKPLANITFWVDDPLNGYEKVNDGLYSDTVVSDANGTLELIVGLPGCPDVEFEVYTDVPPNCELTTKARVPANLNRSDEVLSFGFSCQ